ncbi:MAG TPA: AAA family ATPase [Pyrinomonadaceae bacterium]|nr:AAA family ATPase [Pyrinomonadaceae bacterium]
MSATKPFSLLDRYGLTQTPFSVSPDPKFLYQTPQHKRALAQIRFTVQDRQGLAVLYGDVGMGKSTLVRKLYDLYRADDAYETILLTNPDPTSALQLLKRITDACELPRKRSRLDQMQELEAYLVDRYKAGKNTVLLIDEAQLLRGEQFELIRQLTNFESSSAKLVQIVLAGQNNLRAKLRLKKALLSRAVTVMTLDQLTLDETQSMIEHRVSVAGRPEQLFEPDAIREVYRVSKGVPREIIKLCRSALTTAAINDLDTVPADVVNYDGDET